MSPALTPHPLRPNQRGQTAIFIALIFNVLFIFFAMALNVALVVHDKINLQNAVDLASYYAAQKQAEVLNAIAHQNYMIRQSWKLLSWRYRVLGTMGLDDQQFRHPVLTGQLTEASFPPAQKPAVCVTYSPTWENVPKAENLCKRPLLRIPALPEVKVIAGFLGINQSIATLSRGLRQQFSNQCSRHGAYNWWYAMSILHAYRLDQRNRQQIIKALADNLSTGSNGDFLDLDGQSVLAGAEKTFLKNLTFANREHFQSLELFNSLQGIPAEKWLPSIKINPTIIYTDVENTGQNGCNASPQTINILPQRPEAMDLLNAPFPSGLGAGPLMLWKDDRFLAGSDYQFTLGVEKNPWFMAYVGVRAQTQPRQIFFPMGRGITMLARAFAKPFGGRIGPWYGQAWERTAESSDGPPIDAQLPPRTRANGLLDAVQDPRRLPNYSRFPGDRLGLGSILAQNSITTLAGLRTDINFYKNIKEEMGPASPNDVLAFDEVNNKEPDVRFVEMAAIAPDLFDITYYSIEPNFAQNYWLRLEGARVAYKIPLDIPIRGDLGNHGEAPKIYSIQEQMNQASGRQLQRPEAFYFVRKREHLLTAWLPALDAFNYVEDPSETPFATCAVPDDNLKKSNPGSCVAGGGRTGYSVKIVSRDALFSNLYQVGGAGVSPAAILNPPDVNNGW